MFVLASGSSVRRRMLANAGLTFEVDPADIDERALEGEGPVALATRLAREKALAVSRRRARDLVIGADQVGLTDEDFVLQKPWTRDAARSQLEAMSGRAHTFTSAAAIAEDGEVIGEVKARATVRFHELSAPEIERHLDAEEWRGSAGAYHLEGKGAQLVASLEGHESTVFGLPLFALLSALRARKRRSR